MENSTAAPWINARARRLRVYRFLGNSGWVLLALVLLPHLFGLMFPKIRDVAMFIWLPFGLLLLVLMIPWLLVVLGFQLGAIKCPSCGLRFAQRSTMWIPTSCQNCAFDIYTLRDRDDGDDRQREP